MMFAFTEPLPLQASLKLEGDSTSVADMPLWDTAFARPTIFKVCADDEFIYGLQLTLTVLKPTWEIAEREVYNPLFLQE